MVRACGTVHGASDDRVAPNFPIRGSPSNLRLLQNRSGIDRTGLPHYHWPRYSSAQAQPRSLIFAAKWLEKTRPISLI